jgi:hypothetical protein
MFVASKRQLKFFNTISVRTEARNGFIVILMASKRISVSRVSFTSFAF